MNLYMKLHNILYVRGMSFHLLYSHCETIKIHYVKSQSVISNCLQQPCCFKQVIRLPSLPARSPLDFTPQDALPHQPFCVFQHLFSIHSSPRYYINSLVGVVVSVVVLFYPWITYLVYLWITHLLSVDY